MRQIPLSLTVVKFLRLQKDQNLIIFALLFLIRIRENTMPDTWQEKIVVDPKVLVGKPVVKGTRLSVEFILDLLANGWTVDQILDDYSQLNREDIMAVLKYAAEIVKEEKAYPLT